MLEQVKQAINVHQLLTKGEKVIVGFSGGIDSLCLLHFLQNLTEYELKIWAVYVNYNLRPIENIEEMKLLKQVETKWGINTASFSINLPEKLAAKPESIQLLAREERYRIFRQFSHEIGATKVALAHHRDDQAETVFYRIIRGTGIDGLAGIAYCRDEFYIRPFLAITRAEIREYAALHGLVWVEDSSNQKTKYHRNRLRQQLIPEIESALNPCFKEALLRLSELAREQSDFMKSILNNITGVLVEVDGRIGINVRTFIELHPYLQYSLLREALMKFRPGYQLELKQLLRLREKICLEQSKFELMHLPKRVNAFCEKGYLFFDNVTLEFWQDASYQVKTPGETEVVALGMRFEVCLDNLPNDWGNISNFEVYLEPTMLKLPLTIRFWKPGDLFQPFGLHGSQKLQDFFVNHKIVKNKRHKVPLLVDGADRIVWIVGYRVAEPFRVKDSSVQVWHIKVIINAQNDFH